MNRVRTGDKTAIHVEPIKTTLVEQKKIVAPLAITPLAPVAPISAKLEVPSTLGPLDAVSAVILGALGPPTAGGPLTAFAALQLSRKAAHKILDARPALPAAKLESLIENGQVSLDASKPLDGKDLKSLAKAYVHLSEAETFAQAVLDEAIEGRARAPKKKDRENYSVIVDQARSLLRDIGKAYAIRCPQFTSLMLGAKEWPTQYEKKNGRLEYINSFKSVDPMGDDAKKTAFEGKLEAYLKAGGTMEAVKTLTAQSLDDLVVGERYEYVFTAAGELNYTIIPKNGDGPSPGHTLTAEKGLDFKDTRALCAGEMWISRGTDGEISALCVSAGSGHYKPFFDSLSEVDPGLKALGLDASQIVHYGGPSSARDAARTLLARAGEMDPPLPPRVHELRLALTVAARPGTIVDSPLAGSQLAAFLALHS